MAREPRFTRQFSVVGTEAIGDITDGVAEALKDDKAPVIRAAVSAFYGLDSDGNLRPGDTIEAAVERVAAQMRPAVNEPEIAIV